MSRRKQSNPKPLKREDEEDSPGGAGGGGGGGGEVGDKLSEAASPKTTKSERSPSAPPASPHSNSGGDSPAPRLRLNTSLATDPALRSDSMTVKAEVTSPNSEASSARAPSAAELEYLASITPAFQHAIVTAGRLFPTSAVPEPEALSLPRTRSKAEPPPPPPPPPPPSSVIENRMVAGFVCAPCKIRFSSASTLEAHQTYYCSYRVQAKGRGDCDADDPKSPQAGLEDGEAPSKVSRTGKQYGCPHCSYSADKKVSLNRHMRMHSSSPAAPHPLPVPVILPSPMHNGVVPEPPSPDPSQLVDRYCQDCDIRFSSVKTFKAHKMHYCSSRHAKGSPTSKASSTPTSPTDSQRLSPEPPQVRGRTVSGSAGAGGGQPFLLLRTNPILIVPYSLLQSASVFTGSAPNLPSQDTACILLPNGTVQPMSNLVCHLANEKDVPRTPHHVADQVLKMREESPKQSQQQQQQQSQSQQASSKTSKSEATPLDLSVRRSSESSDLVIDMEDEKENVFTSSPHREDIVCAPSIPSLLGTPEKRSPPEEAKPADSYSSTPSPSLPPSPNAKKSPRRTPNGLTALPAAAARKDGKKLSEAEFQNQIGFFMAEQSSRRNSVSGKGSAPMPLPYLPLLLPTASPDLANQASILPLMDSDLRMAGLLGGRTLSESAVPQVFVKQGFSKCQECNIVFCKHENYIAHKKHYCSARIPDLPPADENSRTSPGPCKSPVAVKESSNEGKSSNQATTATKAPPPQALPTQFGCGISFSSLGCLYTPQPFYCGKGDGGKVAEEKSRRCSKCKVVVNGDHQCVAPGNSNPVASGWKCPCCDVVSPTAAAAQKHMDTHQGVRAFRCRICKYKGNTLRGMRTHIRMHFDKKTNDLQEENFITCILDEEHEAQQQGAATQNNGVSEPSRSSEVVVKVEVAAEDEFVDVDVVDQPPGRKDHHDGATAAAAAADSAAAAADDDDKLTPNNNSKRINYCKTCDISFNYSSSLIAHKKFYCSAVSAESEAQSKSSRTTPETSVQ